MGFVLVFGRPLGVVKPNKKRLFPKIGELFSPKWMVKIMKKPIKMDDLGVYTPIF